MNIHANDGISQSGVDALADFGFTLTTTNVAQEQLVNYINENNIACRTARKLIRHFGSASLVNFNFVSRAFHVVIN